MKTEHPNRTSGPDHAELERIAAELRALGEPELDLAADEFASSLNRETAVLACFALAHPTAAASGAVAQLAPLGELDRQRVWRRILTRRTVVAPRVSASSWRATWVAVATAAGLALVPMLSPHGGTRETTPAARATIEALGLQARAALDGVPGEQDGARATQLAVQYAARLGHDADDSDGSPGKPEAAR